MLRVNDDKDDELFRNAAENYFLGGDKPDWDFFIAQKERLALPAELTGVNLEKKNYAARLSAFVRQVLKKINRKHPGFFRFFRYQAWSGKTKKKINLVFFPLAVLCY